MAEFIKKKIMEIEEQINTLIIVCEKIRETNGFSFDVLTTALDLEIALRRFKVVLLNGGILPEELRRRK